MNSARSVVTVVFALIVGALSVTAQNPTSRTPAPSPTPGTKRNERPDKITKVPDIGEKGSSRAAAISFIYEFSRPGFTIPMVRIEHDETGSGIITFEHRDSDEPITDPVQLTSVTLQRLGENFELLDFLDSVEIYQFERDFSHLGTIKITLKDGERRRTAEFNYTENKYAKAISDEYRKLSNQFVWIFQINLARANRPLDAPKLFELLEGYLRRKEISDPAQLLPVLTALSNDERLPLIARNHALRLIKQIEKSRK